MPNAPIPFPVQGVSDSFSYEDQPPGTSVEAVNVRAVDPTTGRLRGAQREGLARLSTSRLSANGKVQAIATVSYDGRSTTYSNVSSPQPGTITTWDETLNALEIVAVDSQGDVWTVDGSALLVKYNKSGVKQFEFPLPVAASNHVVRALTVDDFGNVYVAVAEGTTKQADAWLRSYYPSAEKDLELRWSVKPGGFTERMHLSGDKLYAAVNFPDTGRARVIAYENLSSTKPDEAQSWSVPYPVNDLDINDAGEVLTAHEPITGRSYDPRVADTTHILDEQRWNPALLEDWDKRKWAWFSAGAIPLQVGSEDIQNGDAITEWLDISGRNACVLKPDSSSPTYESPTYVTNSLGGRPGVRFDGDNYRLVSSGSLGTGTGVNDSQPTLLPSNYGYLVVMVVKASEDYTTTGCLLYQGNAVAGPGIEDRAIWLNAEVGVSYDNAAIGFASCNAGTDTITDSSFDILDLDDEITIVGDSTPASGLTVGATYYVLSRSSSSVTVSATRGGPLFDITGTSGGANLNVTINSRRRLNPVAGRVSTWAAYDSPSPTLSTTPPGEADGTESDARDGVGRFNNPANAAIISILCDNDDNIVPQRSVFRVNGMPLAKWKSDAFNTTANIQSIIGTVTPFSGTSAPGLGADILEILVLRRYTDAAGNNIVCETPDFNANSWGGSGVEPAVNATSDTEIERIEGYFAWKYGISHLLDDGSASAAASPAFDAENIGSTQYEHPFVDTNGPPNPNGRLTDTWDSTLWTAEDGITAKWSPARGVRWATSGEGMGYAVAPDSDDTVFTVGPKGAVGKTVLALTDGGASITEAAGYTNPMSNGQPADYLYKHPRIAVDQFDNVWVPGNWDSELVTTSLRAFSLGATTNLNRLIGYKLLASPSVPQKGRSVALDPTVRDYSDNPNTISFPEAVVLATDSGAVAGQPTLHYLDTVEAEANNAAPRNIVWVAAAGGDIRTFTGGTVAAPTGGTAALDLNSPYVAAVQAFSKVYFTDGQVYKVYDPKADEVTDWLSETSGSIPERCRLMSFWRGRMVLARGPDDPFNWHMSALGDPNDWNQFPPDSPLATQAISGNNSEVGGNHDIINSVIPYDRERLIFGGDHTIHMMWGDPMEGGSIALLSDVTGIAFGSGYAKDSSGILYFYGSRGGIYAMAPGGQAEQISNQPVKISSETIDRKLNTVNLSTHYIGLVWDDVEQILHVYQLPFDQGGTIVDHWCWEKKTGAWWVDRFSHAGVQPTALAVLDGDESDDRVIAVGCEDGYVRYPSRTSTTDDGYVIDSYVTIGPYYTADSQIRVRNPKVTLARDQGGCWLEMFSSDTPDVRGNPIQRMFLSPGQNPKAMVGVRGPYAWLRLRSAAVGQRWAFESGQVELYNAGRKVAP